ncbi:hypothetical protein GCM10022404_15000 [Celeribacter arenosi]|uniref:Uncharacterized protein n=2 Tax=Celeribacter arenosi TaxID=792649 RepID=A0ABP7K563_9RHOB
MVVEPAGVAQSIDISAIQRMRGTRWSLMLFGSNGERLWMNRMPDSWQFESIIKRVISKLEPTF